MTEEGDKSRIRGALHKIEMVGCWGLVAVCILVYSMHRDRKLTREEKKRKRWTRA